MRRPSGSMRLVLVHLLLCGSSLVGQSSLSSKTDYRKYIDPLLNVDDFGIEYVDDGAADATVLFPQEAANPPGRPRDAVISLIRLGSKSIPLLIDCLNDSRVTSVRFQGNNMVRPMNVPVGYVCLDILIGVTPGWPISHPDCSDDGLGACTNYRFYFRPDDYSNCWQRSKQCALRPWIGVVQSNWRNQFLRRRLRFRNPYDNPQLGKYQEFTSQALRRQEK